MLISLLPNVTNQELVLIKGFLLGTTESEVGLVTSEHKKL